MDITTPPGRVAVFDLDGTLTWHDTLVRFLGGYIARRPARLVRLWRLPAALLGYLASGDRGRLKARLIRMTFASDGRADIEAWARRYVAGLAAGGVFRPAALAALEEHRAAGDRLVLLSASPDLYVPLIGRMLGFERTICTEVNWRGEEVDDTLRSANRRGAEKLRCLEALRADYPGARFAAYGNAASDLDHLCRAENSLLVNADGAARRRARRLGVAHGDWR